MIKNKIKNDAFVRHILPSSRTIFAGESVFLIMTKVKRLSQRITDIETLSYCKSMVDDI